jgi:hypothetical protein
MLVSFGPRADQYRAYVEKGRQTLVDGTTGKVTNVRAFYRQTRYRYFPATYSLISLLGPIAAFALTAGFIVLPLGDLLVKATPIPADEPKPNLPFEAFCGAEQGHHDILLNGVLASAFRFSVTHVALFAICALALAAAAASIRNVLETHGFFSSRRGTWVFGWVLALAVPAGAGYFAFGLASLAIGDRIEGLFERLFPVPVKEAFKSCDLETLLPLKTLLYQQAGLGALCVSIGVASLALAAALLAWRFETHDVNGAWSDSYVLRHKLNSLLTLLFVGSVLLVVTNIALASAMDWTSGVLDVVKTATQSASTSPDADGKPPTPVGRADANAGGQRQTQAGGQAEVTGNLGERSAKPDPAGAEFASLKTLKTAILGFAGSLGSLMLVLIFSPALYGVTSEIEIAGKAHASYDVAKSSPASLPPPPPTKPAVVVATETVAYEGSGYRLQIAELGREPTNSEPQADHKPQPVAIPDVAGWKTVQDWKEKHGLKLSFSDITGGFIAALAPFLSGSIVDLTKMTMGAIG